MIHHINLFYSLQYLSLESFINYYKMNLSLIKVNFQVKP